MHATRCHRSDRHVVFSNRRGRQQSKWTSDDSFQFKFREREVSVPKESMWQYGVPLAGFILMSALIGPLVIGMALSAVAIGAALSAGAVAFTTLFFPLMLLMGFGALAFGGMTFGAFATLGVLTIVPKLMALAITMSGLGLGWAAVGLLSGQQQRRAQSDGAAAASAAAEAVDEERDELDAQVRQMARELREFDEVLAKNEEKRRVADWRDRV